jgi:hypothetical protein
VLLEGRVNDMTTDYGISLGYETDVCSVCKHKKEIRIIYRKSTKRSVNICDACEKEHAGITPEELVKKYGKKVRTKAQIKKADQIMHVD